MDLNILTNVTHRFMYAIGSGYAEMEAYSQNLMFILLVIDFTLFGLYMAMGKGQDVSAVIEKILVTGALIWVITNLRSLSMDFSESLVMLASKLGTTGYFSPEFFHNPSAIISTAWTGFLQELGNSMSDQSIGLKEMLFGGGSTSLMIVYGISLIGVILCFVIIALQLALAQIEFTIIVYISLILVPFILFAPTKFIGSKVFSAIAGQAIKLALVAFVIGLSMNIFFGIVHIPDSNDITIPWLLEILATVVVMTFLALQVPALASSLLSGIPNISASGFMQNAAGMMYAGKSVGSGVKAAAHSKTAQAAGSSIKAGATAAASAASGGAAAAGKAAQSLAKKFRG